MTASQPMPDTPQEQITVRQFARRMGQDPSAGNHLAKNSPHRLIWADNGTHVLWPASRDHYLATTENMANTLRHAQARAALAADAAAAPPPPSPAPDNIGNTYAAARAIKERFLALEAKRAYEVAIGRLRDAREVEHLSVTVGTDLRQRLESLALTLAPMLAGMQDEHAIRVMLQDQFAEALASAAHHLRRLAVNPDNPDNPMESDHA